MVGGNAPPVAAGVACSCDPVAGRRGVVTINLAAGSGEAVVGGRIDPEQHLVTWPAAGPDAEIRRTDTTGRVALLDADRLVTLARLVRRVHWALGDGDRPQDVEWAWDGHRFWVLQGRPVTRLPRLGLAGAPRAATTWSNANLRDSFPRPLTTMTWSRRDPLTRDAAGLLETPEDVYHLGATEAEALVDGTWDGRGARRLVADRAARLAREQGVDLPGVITGDEARPDVAPPAPALPAGGDGWVGVAASPGRGDRGRPGCCAPRTRGVGCNGGTCWSRRRPNPGWTPLFLRASAVVMETGGYLSHGAVVARESGSPRW